MLIRFSNSAPSPPSTHIELSVRVNFSWKTIIINQTVPKTYSAEAAEKKKKTKHFPTFQKKTREKNRELILHSFHEQR
jgi:hypothetical protein